MRASLFYMNIFFFEDFFWGISLKVKHFLISSNGPAYFDDKKI